MGFFDSEVVQHEAKQLFEDYQSLMQLGGEYGKFDREGKIIFIDKMEELMDRYKIFMKRFELSEDFMAKMTVEQLKTQLGQFGITPQQMFDQMQVTLERMKSELGTDRWEFSLETNGILTESRLKLSTNILPIFLL
jgi:hypothetical protein